MPLYQMATGHDVALLDLDPIVPQPRSTNGVQAAQRDFGSDGSVFEQGLYLVLEWNSLTSAAAYQTLLAQFNLDDLLRQAVTIYAPDFQRTWRRYNGYAIRPTNPAYVSFPRNIRMVINRLESIG